jgi:hypothetical protein
MLISVNLSTIASQAKAQVEAELPTRAMQAAIYLGNASMQILGKVGTSEKVYRKPAGGTYNASSPGEPPAMRTGTLMRSWRPMVFGAYNPGLEGGTPYAGYLEEGTSKMAARPFVDKIVETAEPQITAIYNAPYNIHIG